jgi:methionine sulfoxide reductase heme-binding subunit
MTPSALRAVKAAVFAACLWPLAWLAWRAFTDDLGANPVEAGTRALGDWALRMLLLALAVTPLRRLTGWSRLAWLRRMLGLFAFAYAALHVLAYAALDQAFDWAAIGADILKRRYISVGATAFAVLAVLAATSTRRATQRLGPARWRALHRLVYVAAPLAVLHYAMMVKTDLRPPLVYGVVVVALLGARFHKKRLETEMKN